MPERDFFFELLSRHYPVVLDPAAPEFLIFSCYGHEFLNYDCPRIFYTAENLRPDFNLCDYAIGFDYLEFGDRYFRFPNYARYSPQFPLLVRHRRLAPSDLAKKTSFCNFIYSNSFADPARDSFFRLLSKYKRVDSPGRHLNNMSGTGGDRYSADWRGSKVEFQRTYKFSIAFENSSSPGYTTEKILHAFIADTVPVYFGNPLIAQEFNPRSFINCHDFDSFEEVAQHVSDLDRDDDRYLAMLNEPPFVGNVIPDLLKEETLLDYFKAIFSQPPAAAFRRPRYGTTTNYEAHQRGAARMISRKNRLMRFCKLPFRSMRRVLMR